MNEAESLQQEIQQVRSHLQADVEAVFDSVRAMWDWRHYVRTYPWTAMGAAVAAGYWSVPEKSQTISAEPERLQKLAESRRLVLKVEPEEGPSRRVAQTTVRLVANLAARSALSYLEKELSGTLEGSEPSRPKKPPEQE